MQNLELLHNIDNLSDLKIVIAFYENTHFEQ